MDLLKMIFPLLAPRWERHGLFDCWPFNDLLKQTPGMHCLKIGYPKIPQSIFIFKIQLPFHGYTPFPNIPRLEQVGGKLWKPLAPPAFVGNVGLPCNRLEPQAPRIRVWIKTSSPTSRAKPRFWHSAIYPGWWFQTFLFSIIYGIILPID